MNRDFLKGLGLESEQIDSIMGRHGSAIATKETEITEWKNKHEAADHQLARLKADNGDVKLQKQLETAEQANKDLQEQLATQSKQHKLETYVNSLGTKDTAYIMAKLEDVELEDDEFVGIEERVEELKEAHPLLFEADEPAPQEPQKPKPWAQRGNGTVTGGEWTKESIMAVEDVGKRQRLIRENKDLF